MQHYTVGTDTAEKLPMLSGMLTAISRVKKWLNDQWILF